MSFLNHFKNPYVIFILAYVTTLFWFGIPTTGDQKVYINTALEMWERGEWLTPYLFDEPSFIKPPFQYWMTLLFWTFFGFNLFATYLAPVFGLLLTVFFLDRISHQLGIQKKEEIGAGTFFAATLGAWTYAYSPQTEIYLVMLGSGAWWAVLSYLKGSQRKFLFLALILAGLLSLVKTPAHSVFWVLGFWLYLALTKQLQPFKRVHFYLAHFLGIVAGIFWYAYAYFFHFDTFLLQYVQQEHLARMYLVHGSVSGIWGAFLLFSLPFLFFLFGFVIQSLIRMNRNVLALVFSWMIFPALVFSYFYYRVNTYLFVLLPAVSIGIVYLVYKTEFRFSKPTFRFTGLLPLFASLFVAAVFLRVDWIPFWILLLLVFSSALFCFFAWKMDFQKLVLAQFLILFSLRLCMVNLGETDIHKLKEMSDARPQQRFGFLTSKNVWNESGILSTAASRPIDALYGVEQALDLLQNNGVLIVDEGQKGAFQDLIDRGQLESQEWKRWQKRRFFPLKELIQFKELDETFEKRSKRTFYFLYPKVYSSS